MRTLMLQFRCVVTVVIFLAGMASCSDEGTEVASVSPADAGACIASMDESGEPFGECEESRTTIPDEGMVMEVGENTVTIPADAVEDPLEIKIIVTEDPKAVPEEAGVPDLPSGTSKYIVALPHGTVFDAPVTFAIDFEPAPEQSIFLFKLDGPEDGTWEEVTGAVYQDGKILFNVESFSIYMVQVSTCVPGTPCNDGNACTTGDTCREDGSCLGGEALACDDGFWCNGEETCDPVAGCLEGEAPQCDDEVSCTEDTCNEETDSCDHTPEHSVCDDGAWCNGSETCDAELGCRAGTAPVCEDGIACTEDGCNEETDSCDHAANDGLCDDGAWCNGAETCDAELGCRAGTAPVCDDGIACTEDTCNEETDACEYSAQDSLCDDGAWCNGTEKCNETEGCQSGTAPVCDDGIACTENTCNEETDACEYSAQDSLCDDGAWCNGAETCDAALGCQSGTAPVCDDGIDCTEDGCNEETDACEYSAQDSLCDDGAWCNGTEKCNETEGCQDGTPPSCVDSFPCTQDACNETTDTCDHTPVDSVCDDGAWCNGAETCSETEGCQDGTAPDCDDAVACTDDSCNEATDTCDHAANDGLCDDGAWCNGAETCSETEGCQDGLAPDCNDAVACTDDSCNEGTDSCDHTANDGLCDDGAWCNGAETCSETEGCQDGLAPDCNDAVACTDDSCNEGKDSCDHTANDGLCDDGAWCNGAETCDETEGCQDGTAPDCDDAVACTDDSCNEGTDSCDHAANDGLCDDGAWCNGAETCNETEGCQDGAAPDCDDAVACTDDSCNEATDTCDHAANDGLCDDGAWCNGAETCNETEGCQDGAAPDCDDAVACTDDSCNEGTDTCDHAANDALCDDGAWCNGAETCNETEGCQDGTAPDCDDAVACTNDSCNEGTDTCDHAANNGLCDDGVDCTDDTCDVDTGCSSSPNHVACDDENDCTADTCDTESGCLYDSMTDGTSCEDGNPCLTGDTCSSGSCASGDDPPPVPLCDFGDAPETSYLTLLPGGAHHLVQYASVANIYLGACVDEELDGQPGASADGDDSDGGCDPDGDEDGVAGLEETLIAGEEVDLTITASAPAYLDAWIDYDGDGEFEDPEERLLTGEDRAVDAGANEKTVQVPGDAAAGETFARFRVSTSEEPLGPSGYADHGEVEDYAVTIEDAAGPEYLLASIVSSGNTSTCSAVSGGGAKCWGHNDYGQLSDGTNYASTLPVDVVGLSSVTSLTSSEYTNGRHHCALQQSGGVKCWGRNSHGQLGNGTTTNSSTPVDVSSLSSGVARVASGDIAVYALLDSGEIRAWGSGTDGQLGNGTTTSSSTPVTVSGISDATAIGAGAWHACAVVSGGTVKCWGSNGSGQLGNGTTTDASTPVTVSGLSGAVDVDGGYMSHTCALLSGGGVSCWGHNYYGQLGNGTTTNSTTPVAVSGISNAVAISLGGSYSCAVLSDGTVKCWGSGSSGKLGDGTATNSSTPVTVSGISDAVQVDAGVSHACAVLSDGTVQCWGSNHLGQLGDGTKTNSSTPVTVLAGPNACGDSILYGEEECDDGNTTDGDGCDGACLSEGVCGNNFVDSDEGEECDDGNTVSGDGCSETCQSECGGFTDPCMHPSDCCSGWCNMGMCW